MADSEDDITNCPVCFEEYTEEGDHVPRILPCYHTVCEKCIEGLLQDFSLDCPECRVAHHATHGIKIFPQNRYILTHIRTKAAPVANKNESLLSKVEVVSKELNSQRENILAAKEEFQKENAIIVNKITARRDLVMRVVGQRFEKLLKDAAVQMEEVNKIISEEITSIDENLALVNSIGETTDDSTSEEDVLSRLETVKAVAKQAKVNSSKERRFKNLSYIESQANVEDVKKLSGSLREKETCVKFTEKGAVLEDAPSTTEECEKENEVESNTKSVCSSSSQSNSPFIKRPNPSLFTCQVNQSIGSECSHILYMSQVGGNRLVVCGQENGQYRLTLYDLQDEDLCSTTLKEEPGGVSRIKLGGKQCIAVSYPNNREITFYDANNLTKVICKYPVAPHQPYVMCTACPATLLYTDKIRHVVSWLDCRALTPSPVPHTKVSTLHHDWIRGMCCVEAGGGKQLLITTHFSSSFDKKVRSGVRAYNVSTGEVEWSAMGKVAGMHQDMAVWGVAVDWRGHLFVSDITNMCVQVFSVDGVYIGAILKHGELGLGELLNICWFSNTSSLVVSHSNSNYSDSLNEITIINVSKVERDSSARSASGSGSKRAPTRGRGRAIPRPTEVFYKDPFTLASER